MSQVLFKALHMYSFDHFMRQADAIIIPILYIRKLRQRKVNDFPKFTLVSGRAGMWFHLLYYTTLLFQSGARDTDNRLSQNSIIMYAHT